MTLLGIGEKELPAVSAYGLVNLFSFPASLTRFCSPRPRCSRGCGEWPEQHSPC
jgi:hypothetical protein